MRSFKMKNIFFTSLVFLSLKSFAQVEAKASVNLFPAGDFVAEIKSSQGTAIIEKKKLIVPDITLDLSTLATGLNLRDEHAKNKYLDVKKFPKAVLSNIQAENGKGSGMLQIRDKKIKIDGTYTIAPDKKTVTADFKIKLSDYGISDINYKGVGVEDEVNVQVKINVAKGAAPAASTKNVTDDKKKNDKK